METPSQKPYNSTERAVHNPSFSSVNPKLTVRLSRPSLEFVKAYAKANGLTVTEIIERYFESLRLAEGPLGGDVKKLTDLIPVEIDARAEYPQHLRGKHSQ